MLETVNLSKDELSQISVSLANRLDWLRVMYERTGVDYYSQQAEQVGTAHDKICRALCR